MQGGCFVSFLSSPLGEMFENFIIQAGNCPPCVAASCSLCPCLSAERTGGWKVLLGQDAVGQEGSHLQLVNPAGELCF